VPPGDRPGRGRPRARAAAAGLTSLVALSIGVGGAGVSPSSADEPERPRSPRAARLAERVEDRLARSPSLAGTGIRVRAHGAASVELTGSVGSDRERQRAVHLAERVFGVASVEDDLRVDAAKVDERRRKQVGDDALARSIAESLVREVFPDSQVEQEWLFGWELEGEDWEFDVEVDGGSVTLEGTVERREQIAEARRAVRSMPGVRSVDTRLRRDHEYELYPYDPLRVGQPFRTLRPETAPRPTTVRDR